MLKPEDMKACRQRKNQEKKESHMPKIKGMQDIRKAKKKNKEVCMLEPKTRGQPNN